MYMSAMLTFQRRRVNRIAFVLRRRLDFVEDNVKLPAPMRESVSKGSEMRIFSIVAAALGLSLLAGAAQAHPHVWVAVKSAVLFDGEGRVSGVRHAWAFDDMYSAYVTMGLGKDGKPPTR